jgi:hypothetical protein
MRRIITLTTTLLATPLLATALLAAHGQAQGSITTLFAANNGLSAVGSGQMFDVTVKNPAGLRITSFEVNSNAAAPTPVTIDVYITPNTYLNNDLNPRLWVQVATGTGNALGRDQKTPIDTSDFFLAPGKYGIYLIYTNPSNAAVGPAYTDGTTSNRQYQNADVQLDLGIAHSTPWGGSRFDPRVWNGTIYYDKDNVGAHGRYGYGCTGSNNQVPVLDLGSEPRIGSSVSFDVTDLLVVPASSGFLFLGAPKLFVDLSIVGMPGCALHVNPIFTLGFANLNGVARFNAAIPNQASLIGGIAHLQAASLDPSLNSLGMSVSNGLSVRLGN